MAHTGGGAALLRPKDEASDHRSSRSGIARSRKPRSHEVGVIGTCRPRLGRQQKQTRQAARKIPVGPGFPRPGCGNCTRLKTSGPLKEVVRAECLKGCSAEQCSRRGGSQRCRLELEMMAGVQAGACNSRAKPARKGGKNLRSKFPGCRTVPAR